MHADLTISTITGRTPSSSAFWWQRAGHRKRVVELLTGVTGEGGEYGCDARVHLAGPYLEGDDTDPPTRNSLRRPSNPALHEEHCELAAEQLAEHGDLVQAARSFNLRRS